MIKRNLNYWRVWFHVFIHLFSLALAGGEVCEMQIGTKVVKVQKIVMTKAEVEAMAKKGLVEMKVSITMFHTFEL